MEGPLSGKTALVGGSSRGIGKATALALAGMGANVILLARTAEKLQAVLDLLPVSDKQTHAFLAVDFSRPDELREKVATIVADRPVHILVNNTGGPPGGPIVSARPEAFNTAFNNHLICNHILAGLVVPGMKAAGYGRIINIISTSVKQPLDNLGVSNTIRGAVANWAKTMANELGPAGITVNNVLPGATGTERLEEIIRSKAEKSGKDMAKVAESMKQAIPLRRFAEPAEIAGAVAFLASPAAAYITGINLPVDGGRTKSL